MTAATALTAKLLVNVAVTANTMYVASYFAPNSHYASNFGMLRMLASTNALLYALQMGARGEQSLYRHVGSPMFSANTYNRTNHWVDAVFTATAP